MTDKGYLFALDDYDVWVHLGAGRKVKIKESQLELVKGNE